MKQSQWQQRQPPQARRHRLEGQSRTAGGVKKQTKDERQNRKGHGLNGQLK